MSVFGQARTLIRTATSARLLRRILAAQEASAAALTEQNRILNALGRVIAGATSQQWSGVAPARPTSPLGFDEDASGLSYVDDDRLGRIEQVQDDYLDRFQRVIGAEEALGVLADQEQATREIG